VLRPLGQLRAGALLLLFLLAALTRLLQTLQFRLLLRALGVRLGIAESCGLVLWGSLYSYLAPARPGLGMQALYLKRRYRLSLAHFGSLVAASALLLYLSAALLGLTVAGYGHLTDSPMPATLVLAFAILLASSVTAVLSLLILGRLVGLMPVAPVRKLCLRLHEGLEFLFRRRALVLQVLGLRVSELVASAFSLLFACRAIGVPISLVQALPLRALARLALLVPLTPGNLGAAEGVQAAAAGVWGLPAASIALAALLARGVGITVVLGGGMAFNWRAVGGILDRTAGQEWQEAAAAVRDGSGDATA
jgi:uncharacterized membrane protein YbhN (UPF0104 family)